MGKHLFIYGFGYVAAALSRRLTAKGWRVSGTHRRLDGAEAIRAAGAEPVLITPAGLRNGESLLDDVTHILGSAPPTDSGDPFIAVHGAALAALPGTLAWLGYLSTTGVYGDAGGDWVDEAAPLAPVHARGARRVAAEAAWATLGEESGAPAVIFRLPGIYGPGRSAFDNLRAGTAKRLVKPGQVFSRIHVADIAAAIEAALALTEGTVLNIADDEPAPPQDVVTYAAELLGIAPPPEIPFESAKAGLSAMALEFYGANRRIANGRMKEELGLTLAFPTYREGLKAILVGEGTAGGL
ncbi:Protein YeeZ [Alphaproteobacteria bacterium SO-S41]|nr:Protein YeeZ [Alphaproteobacteria bacterium SO-S41]